MKLGQVKDLIEFLGQFSPEAEVVVDLNIDTPWGYGYLASGKPGTFCVTDYGNDFYDYEEVVVNPLEFQAVCLSVEPHDLEFDSTDNPKSQH